MSVYGEFLKQFQADVELRNRREQELGEVAKGPSPEQMSLVSELQARQTEFTEELSRLETEHADAIAHVERSHQLHQQDLDKSHQSVRSSVTSEANLALSQLEKQHGDSEWVVSSVLDDHAEDSPARELARARTTFEKTRDEQSATLSALGESFRKLSEQRSWAGDPTSPPEQLPRDQAQAQQLFQSEVEEADRCLRAIPSLVLPKLYSGLNGLGMLVLIVGVIGATFFYFADPSLADVTGPRMQQNWILASSVAGFIGGIVAFGFLYLVGSTQESYLFSDLNQAFGNAQWFHEQWVALAEKEFTKQEKVFRAQQRRIEQERQNALDRYEAAHQEQLQVIESTRDEKLAQEQERYDRESSRIQKSQDEQTQDVNTTYNKRIAAFKSEQKLELDELQNRLQGLRSSESRQQIEMWTQLKSEWEESTRLFFDAIDVVGQSNRAVNPSWNEIDFESWQPATEIPNGVSFGWHFVDFHDWPAAVSDDMRLAPRKSSFELPAEPEFPGHASTLFKSPNKEARTQAHAALQSMMLRLLLQIPPGKIRLTMIDPIGLGETFGGFMHLADYDELMVTNRVWTEAGQIESRLADLTEHMENVFQTYLRNEFQTIEEYNESAGEVAEPYHFLVISDFPTKFSEIAARRLVSIITSGPRCGVYTLINVDPTKQLPNNFDYEDIESHLTCYEWRDSHFHATEESLSPWPITIEMPPGPDVFTSIVKMVGEASKDARRVEVSFERIAPQPSEVWRNDARTELQIPLGRSGATKLQQLKLGRGTSQHMLVAGKTGSGKSTFLHIMITNLALHYGPNEVNFFLIDFKKGVEFKDYATYGLPHAQVIAIESDREFGVSALQRLDEVLQERGELFRRHGVQDIASFRNANPDEAMPRILLIVDEFQEFFVEDDKLSQTASLLLDRLVRQGRAFGIHVILGSQTLGGAYSLARTTLGQVAVRVALQCSEADAHLILSEENTAARLLTRPGEAIYNDANGMMEGNHPFQIAWISDEERNGWLQQLHHKTERAGIDVAPPIVFEGNIPSDLGRNSHLQKLALNFRTREQALTAPTVWFGDAVEIKPATEFTFHRQSGSHILIVGQDSEAALGTMMAAALATAASAKINSTQDPIVVFDGSPAETDDAKLWKTFADSIPVNLPIYSPRNVVEGLHQLTEALNSRMEDPDSIRDTIVVFVHNISKFRDLRKSEDDFGIGGFGSSTEEKPADPGKLFSTLLTEGPIVGIHFVIWCDSSNNVDRWFSRQTQKELEQRIVFQMNASDSSQLIDSPAASRLGSHRALLYREETGLSEKFRPYGPPSASFLREFGEAMKNGTPSDIATDLEEFSIM